jgi:hypothetical protein
MADFSHRSLYLLYSYYAHMLCRIVTHAPITVTTLQLGILYYYRPTWQDNPSTVV